MATVPPTDVAGAVQPQVPIVAPAEQSALTPLEKRVVLYNVSWETYERLVEEIDNPGTRLTYDQGVLEIMSPISQRHERLKKLLGYVIEVLTEELGVPRRSLGSTTWKRSELAQGVEADECYYLTTEPMIRSKQQIDLDVDPPPDLALEVENTTSSVDKLSIYAALRVPEVWRFDGQELLILALQPSGQYEEQSASKYFSTTALGKAVEWIGKGDETDDTTWVREFRRWVRENLVKT